MNKIIISPGKFFQKSRTLNNIASCAIAKAPAAAGETTQNMSFPVTTQNVYSVILTAYPLGL